MKKSPCCSQCFIQIRDSRSTVSPAHIHLLHNVKCCHCMYIYEAPYNPLTNTPVKTSHKANVWVPIIAFYTISVLARRRLCAASEAEAALSGPGSVILPMGSFPAVGKLIATAALFSLQGPSPLVQILILPSYLFSNQVLLLFQKSVTPWLLLVSRLLGNTSPPKSLPYWCLPVKNLLSSKQAFNSLNVCLVHSIQCNFQLYT